MKPWLFSSVILLLSACQSEQHHSKEAWVVSEVPTFSRLDKFGQYGIELTVFEVHAEPPLEPRVLDHSPGEVFEAMSNHRSHFVLRKFAALNDGGSATYPLKRGAAGDFKTRTSG